MDWPAIFCLALYHSFGSSQVSIFFIALEETRIFARPYDVAAINFGSPQLIYIHPVIPLLWKSHGVLALQALREFMLNLVSQFMEESFLKRERENESLMKGTGRDGGEVEGE